MKNLNNSTSFIMNELQREILLCPYACTQIDSDTFCPYVNEDNKDFGKIVSYLCPYSVDDKFPNECPYQK